MIARLAIVISYALFIINAGFVLHFEASNVLEKGAFLATSALLLLTRRVNPAIIMLLALTTGLIFFQGAQTTWPGFSWGTLIVSLNQITIIYAMLAFYPTERDADVLLKVTAWLPVASVLLGFVYTALGWSVLFKMDQSSGVMRLQGSLIPAYLAGVAMCGTFSATVLALVRQRPVFFALAVANLLILVLSGGRAAVAVTFFVLMISVATSRSIRGDQKFWLAAGGVAILPIFGLIFGPSLIQRFMTSGENGRQITWKYLEGLEKLYPNTGIGFGHQYLSVPREVFVQVGSNAAHNDFIRISVELGYIGMLLFFGMLTCAVLIAALRDGKLDWTMLAAYAGFLFMANSDNALATPADFTLIILAAVSKSLTKTPATAVLPRARLWRQVGLGRSEGLAALKVGR